MNTTNYYLSEIHLFQSEGTHFAFLPRNLQLFELDQGTYLQIQKIHDEYDIHSPIQTKDDDLLAAGIIYEATEPREDPLKVIYEAQAKENADNMPNIPINNVVLQIANDCNLNCIYCYGDGGSYGRERELMTFETAKKAIDLMVSNSEGLTELSVVFFGGEPLINFEVVKQTFEYCKSLEENIGKKFVFSMTTNGTILTDEIYHFIKDNKISVMISVDGGKELQDKHRCYCDGRGSFDDVKKNIERFKEARGGFLTARATVCRTDFRFKKIRDDLLDMGFTNAVTSIVDTAENSPLFIGGAYTDQVLEQYQILADDYVAAFKEGRKNPNILFANILDKLYFKKLKIRSCSAGSGGLAVGTDGNIYPCHRFMGMPEYIVGTLEDGIDEHARGNYRNANIFTKEECKTCWARYLCNGGCTHTSAAHGDIYHAPICYCDIYKGLNEILLNTYWKLKTWDDDFFRKMLEKEDKKVNTL